MQNPCAFASVRAGHSYRTMSSGDTIFALSSGALPSGVAVMRISGPNVEALASICRGGLPVDRQPVLRVLEDSRHGIIDRALVLRMWAPHSFTGEDTVELHLHGGRAVVSACLDALGTIAGFRHAEPGEFSRRAFLNGKVDLYEAEALADLITADTEAQRRMAIENSAGANSRIWSDWMEDLTEARALLEAEFDFSDEEDVPDSMISDIVARLNTIISRMRMELDRVHSSEIISEGFRVVLAGAPNVGKSSLLNSLAKRDVAIVSDEAGTTRDLVEVSLDLDGFKLVVTDTAGFRSDAGRVERLGIERANAAIDRADLVLWISSPEQECNVSLGEFPGKDVWLVRNKADLEAKSVGHGYRHQISVATGAGLDSLLADLASTVRLATQKGTGTPLLFRSRQQDLCIQAVSSLENALQMLGVAPELAAEDLRVAMRSIGRITGSVDVEDLLDVIFSRFCIGK